MIVPIVSNLSDLYPIPMVSPFWSGDAEARELSSGPIGIPWSIWGLCKTQWFIHWFSHIFPLEMVFLHDISLEQIRSKGATFFEFPISIKEISTATWGYPGIFRQTHIPKWGASWNIPMKYPMIPQFLLVRSPLLHLTAPLFIIFVDLSMTISGIDRWYSELMEQWV